MLSFIPKFCRTRLSVTRWGLKAPYIRRFARIITFILPLLLLVPLAVWAQSSPASFAKEWEMESNSTPPAHNRAENTAVLGQFKKEFQAADEAERPTIELVEKYLPLVGASALLDVLEDTYPTCHGQAHDLGKALFITSHDLGAALRTCGARCTSGCMHGAVAAAFGSSTLEAITAQMNTFCE